jgi:pyruvate kinase
MIIREANIAGKSVITATQMLESMIHNPRPTRAECSDVANALLDGTDVVMLSGETAIGPYYDKACRVMARTICEAEASRNYDALFSAVRNSVLTRFDAVPAAESLASSAVKTAIDIGAAIIVVLSESGTTARFIAKYRPGKTIVCLTTDPRVARQVSALLKGVHSYVVGSLLNDEFLSKEAGQEAVDAGIAAIGDLMVVVSGSFSNNQVRVEVISGMDRVSDLPERRTSSSRVRRKTVRRLVSFEIAYNDDEFIIDDESGN